MIEIKGQIQSGECQITSCYVVFTACSCRLILLHRYYKRKSSKLLDMLKRIIIQISAIPFYFRKFSFVEVFQILNLSNSYADYHPLKAAVSWRNTFNFPSFIKERNNSNSHTVVSYVSFPFFCQGKWLLCFSGLIHTPFIWNCLELDSDPLRGRVRQYLQTIFKLGMYRYYLEKYILSK